ncbi:uncharacterized protein E0L32_009705 [Thyridium curvatum]|uniref:Enoyl reductase (ER) domain-containing protein n=1 Tax=Thyridium curvatum TaxID=1093900 RepID=A0A507AGC4_9PEZI|nr:uncharacterized protein E0L32_009705 [Thyridium curvatum]TPX08765.1 hypothetical protein E0L32_009705 [Thyridium curvatum]
MATTIPTTHKAVAVPGLRQNYTLIDRPTKRPAPGEALVRVDWAASSPADVHVIDGGVADPQFPFVTGTCFAGTVVQMGARDPAAAPHRTQDLRAGDPVLGFTFGPPDRKTHQAYLTTPTYNLGRRPPNVSPEQASTVPANLVTAFHTLTRDLGLPLADGQTGTGTATDNKDKDKDKPVLLWGAASGVGQYAAQVLRHYGYANVVAVASARHHAYLAGLGATACFDYRDPDVVERVRAHLGGAAPPYVIDCIGSREGTLRPLTKIAGAGSRVAVMLPVITREAATGDGGGEVPEYEMDIGKVLAGEWAEGVEVRGVRTYFYQENEFFKYHLMPEIVPDLLAKGVIQPNRYKVVEGPTMLERAQGALDILRGKAQSGEKIIWRVSDE